MERSGEHEKVEFIEFIPPHVHSVKESEKKEEVEEEEMRKKPKWKKMLPNCKVLMDPEVLPKLIPYSNEEFQAQAGKFSDVIHNTTWRYILEKYWHSR